MKHLYLIFLFSPFTLAQWEIGVSYLIKNEIPENGIGINVSRNLPYQWPAFGIKARAGVDLFRQQEVQTFNGISKESNFTSEDFHIEIIGNFFLRNISPYFGFGSGYGNINVNQLHDGSFLINFLAGLNLSINNFIKPYLEVRGFNYFSDFDSSISGKDISSFQFRAILGISFSIDTLQ